MITRYLILILILSLAFLGSSVSAQVRSTDIVLSISPEFPGPNQSVTATLGSFSTNLDKAYISWSVDNEEASGGIGKKTFFFTTKNSNSPLSISANINTIDGQSIQKTITITPTTVDMLWEASDSYAPPFYKGKTLVGSQGVFKVVAIPNLISQGAQVNMNNLSYIWNKDGDIQPESSGWGKSSFILQNSYLDKQNTVSVKISDISGGATSSGNLTLFTSNPKIVFYENDFLLGTRWERALTNNFQINPNGTTIVVEPYFFSPQNLNSSNLNLLWSLNREGIKTPNPKNSLSVKPDAGQKGSALIKVVVNNILTLFQSAEKEINVQF